MKCKVLNVYKDGQGKQCMVDYICDGQKAFDIISKFTYMCKIANVEQENFKIISDGISGKGCKLKFREYMTWDEIVKKYPKKWIAMDRIKYKPNSLSVDSAIIIKVLEDSEVGKFMEYTYDNDLPYEFKRTVVDYSVLGAIRR